MDMRLSRKHTPKRYVLRALAVAACLVLVVSVTLSIAALNHPVSRAILQGDYEAMAEQLNQIEGFEEWREQAVARLEQTLPEQVFGALKDTPIFQAMAQPQLSDLSAQDFFEDGKPYHLYFLSNGDGTCTLKYVTTDPDYTEGFVLEIPSTSPRGDKVTAIALNQGTRVKQSQHEDFPYVLTAYSMEALSKTAIDSNMSGFDYTHLTRYYLKLSVAGLDERAREAMLAAYPITALGDIYVFDTNASALEAEKIYEYLTEYCGWNQEKYQQSVDEIVNMAKQCESREQAELCLSVLRTADLRGAVELSIPESVRSIDSELWRVLSGLESVTVAMDHPTMKMVDGCLVDTSTDTLMLYQREDGKFPEDLDVQVLGSYAFAFYKPQPSVVNGQTQVDIHVPESVIQINDDCFAGLELETEWVCNIYLPKDLSYFGVQEQDLYSGPMIFHYPGTMEEWKSDVTLGVAERRVVFCLRTADMAEPEYFHFMAILY
jgi:hypothetical protein